MSQQQQYRYARIKPNRQQVEKIKRQLEGLNGLSTNKKLDYVFEGIITYEQGYNIATITLAFVPDSAEIIDGIEYPNRLAMWDMKAKIRYFRESTLELRRSLILYPSRDENNKGEWRYFNIQTLQDFESVSKMDNVVIKAIKRWIRTVTTILKENPEYRNNKHSKEVSEIRYELMQRRRMIKRLEKKKAQQVTTTTDNNTATVMEEVQQGAEQQNNETNEK